MKAIDDLYRRIGEYPWRGETDMAEFDGANGTFETRE